VPGIGYYFKMTPVLEIPRKRYAIYLECYEISAGLVTVICMFAFVAFFQLFSTKPRYWLGRTSTK